MSNPWDPADYRVLLVGDEGAEVHGLFSTVEGWGYECLFSQCPTEGLSLIQGASFDLVIIDVCLSEMSWFDLLATVRDTCDPRQLIMIVGGQSEVDRVLGYELGADDMMSRPFSSRELQARMHAHLRHAGCDGDPGQRTHPMNPPAKGSVRRPIDQDVQRFDGLRLHRDTHRLYGRENEVLALTGGEYDLLTCLLDTAGRVVTRHQLMELCRGRSDDAFDRSIDVLISRLRKKIERDPKNPALIQTIRGVGYICTARVT